MAEKDYYKILGVSKSASKEEIKNAYKKLAKQHHPDISKEHGATEKFKEINEAASVLGDDQKRRQYDQYGSTGSSSQNAGGFSGFDNSDFSGQGFGFDFDSIFDTFFGGSGHGRQRRKQKGSDLRYDMEITLEEAAFGVSKTITVPRYEECEKCKGTGAESQSDIITCRECNGKGTSTKTQRTPFGMFQTSSTCRTCRGAGKEIKNECGECDGQGIIRKTRKLEVKIPSGANDGTQLRVQGAGEAGDKGTAPGDLYIVIQVKEHDLFERQENDVYIKIPVPFSIAAIGGKIEVPTLKGKADLKIPAGTQSNTVFRMNGQGIPDLRYGNDGDELVEVVIDVPKKLTKKQKKLLEDFEKESGKKGFLEKVFD